MNENGKRAVSKIVVVALIAVAFFAFPGMDWRHILLLAAQLVVFLI